MTRDMIATLPDRPEARSLPPEPPAHQARLLTGGGRTARICHDGQEYTLRITRQGKLILTK